MEIERKRVCERGREGIEEKDRKQHMRRRDQQQVGEIEKEREREYHT